MVGMKCLYLPMALAALALLPACKEKKEMPAPQPAAAEEAATPAAEEPAPAAAPTPEPALSGEVLSLLKAAEGGDAVAQNNLALLYAEGKEGLPGDAAKAAELYRAAAEQGNAVAQFNLARCYALGEGVETDEKAFIEYCTKAAYAGLPAAQYTLGCAYRDGLGVAEDAIEAERWLSRAEMNGYEPAKAAWKALREQKK